MRRWARGVLAVTVVLALGGAVILTWMGLGGGDACVAAQRDLDGRCVELDVEQDAAVGPDRGRFQAPEQGLDVPLVEMAASGGVLNPPTLTEAFLVRDPERTTPDGTRPRVVAMHAVRDGRAPGNAFFEPGARNPAVRVSAGDELVVDGVAYVVESTEVLTKSEAASSTEIWGGHPDGDERLVVLTCLQRAGSAGPATENLVVHAVRT